MVGHPTPLVALVVIDGSGVHVKRCALPSTTCREIMTSLTPSRLGRSNIVSRSTLDVQSIPRTRLAIDRLPGDNAECFLCQCQNDVLISTAADTALPARSSAREDTLERRLVEILQGRHHRKAADEFGDHAVIDQVFRLDFEGDLVSVASSRVLSLASKPIDRPATRRDHFLEADEGAAAMKRMFWCRP